MTDFEQILEALAAADVEFVIVGGLAATAHGSARLAQDVDVAYARTPDNIGRVVSRRSPSSSSCSRSGESPDGPGEP